jgi:hypothetical protein
LPIDNGTTGNSTGGTADFEGTWTKGNLQITFSGSTFISKVGGVNNTKGTFSVYEDSGILSETATHFWIGTSWYDGPDQRVSFHYYFADEDTLELSGGTGSNTITNGTWVRPW